MKYLTMVLIPYEGADVKSIKISHRKLKVLSVLGVIVICGIIVLALYLMPVFNKARAYNALVLENSDLKEQNQKILALETKIGSIDMLVSKIRMAQGIHYDPLAGDSAERSNSTGLNDIMTMDMDKGFVKGDSSSYYRASSDGIPRGRPTDEKSFISRTFDPDIYHFGVDFALKQGTPIKVTMDGVVLTSDSNENLGNYVIIEHSTGYRTLYAHNSEIKVKKGNPVRKSDVIALSGNTGMSSGPHLHYAIFDKDNNPIDPLPYLNP